MFAVLALLGSAHAAALPAMTVDWATVRGRPVAWLYAQPPTGEHVAPEAPVSGQITVGALEFDVSTKGEALAGGLPLPAPGHQRVIDGELKFSLCKNGGTACREVSVAFRGQIEGRVGHGLALSVQPPETPKSEATVEPLTVDAALDKARTEDKLVLIDFAAQWCPPCNLLAAEVIHNPADAEALSPFVVAQVDVDTRASWTVKDHYQVGSYPTLVVVRPDGTEVDRMVGYPGEQKVLDWLSGLSGRAPLSALPDPATLSPTDAARMARRLAEADRADEAAAYLTRAATGEVADDVDFRLARFLVTPNAADVSWLVAHDENDISSWLWPALDLVDEHPDIVEPLRHAIDRALPDAGPNEAADLLWAAAKLADPKSAPTLYAAAAASLDQVLTGDPAHDRGYWTYLAKLYEGAGQLDRAVQVLGRGQSTYPHEFTFHHAQAALLLRQQMYEAALPHALMALATGYGDMRLRAAMDLAKALSGSGHTDKAISVLDRALADTPAPDPKLHVRTTRYRDQVKELREQLASKANPGK